MLTAPDIVIAYARHRCNARVAMQAGDDYLAGTCLGAATEAARHTAGTEWQLIDRIAAALDRDPPLCDFAEVMRRAGLHVQEGV